MKISVLRLFWHLQNAIYAKIPSKNIFTPMAISIHPPTILALTGRCLPRRLPNSNPTRLNAKLVAAMMPIASHSTSGIGMNSTPIDSASILVATANPNIIPKGISTPPFKGGWGVFLSPPFKGGWGVSYFTSAPRAL